MVQPNHTFTFLFHEGNLENSTGRVWVTQPVLFSLLGHRRIRPVDDVALLHLAHVEENVLPHLDVLT